MNKPEDYQYMRSGRAVLPSDFSDKDIDIKDIAIALSRIYRYLGQSNITVLRHSVALEQLVSDNLGGDDKLMKAALLHDAPEAYCGDMMPSQKQFLRPEWFLHYDKIEFLIFKKYLGKQPDPDRYDRLLQLDKAQPAFEMLISGLRPDHAPIGIDFQYWYKLYRFHETEGDLINYFIRRFQK